MGWFNYYGLIIMAVIMAPNIVYYVKHKDEPADRCKYKAVEVGEQISRYACFGLMIFNIPYTYFGFWFEHALVVYLAVNGGLCLAYILFWVLLWSDNGLTKAVALSCLPTVVFLFSGIVIANIPLIIFAVGFGATHIYISVSNALKPGKRRKKYTRREKITGEVIALFILLLFVCVVISILYGTDASI